jgi:hypothetical protein
MCQGHSHRGKNKLVKAICATLREAYPYPDDVRIFLREWRPDSVSQDGQLGLDRVALDGGLHSDNKARVEAQKEVYRYEGAEQNERAG